MIRSRLSYANVMSTLAVVLAIAGGSTAIAMSASKNSVTSKSIKPGNVTASDLAAIDVVVSENVVGPVSATCPVKERLIAGGAKGANVDPLPPGVAPVALRGSYPSGNSWVVERSSGSGGGVQAFALCLKAKPGK